MMKSLAFIIYFVGAQSHSLTVTKIQRQSESSLEIESSTLPPDSFEEFYKDLFSTEPDSTTQPNFSFLPQNIQLNSTESRQENFLVGQLFRRLLASLNEEVVDNAEDIFKLELPEFLKKFSELKEKLTKNINENEINIKNEELENSKLIRNTEETDTRQKREVVESSTEKQSLIASNLAASTKIDEDITKNNGAEKISKVTSSNQKTSAIPDLKQDANPRSKHKSKAGTTIESPNLVNKESSSQSSATVNALKLNGSIPQSPIGPNNLNSAAVADAIDRINYQTELVDKMTPSFQLIDWVTLIRLQAEKLQNWISNLFK